MHAIVLSPFLPDAAFEPRILSIAAQWFTPTGIALPPQSVPFQVGIPLEMLVSMFVQALNANLVQQKVTKEDGTEKVVPFRGLHRVIVPPKAAEPKPPPRIVVAGS